MVPHRIKTVYIMRLTLVSYRIYLICCPTHLSAACRSDPRQAAIRKGHRCRCHRLGMQRHHSRCMHQLQIVDGTSISSGRIRVHDCAFTGCSHTDVVETVRTNSANLLLECYERRYVHHRITSHVRPWTYRKQAHLQVPSDLHLLRRLHCYLRHFVHLSDA